MHAIYIFLLIGTMVWLSVQTRVEDGEVAYLPLILRVPAILFMAPIGLILHTVAMAIDFLEQWVSGGDPGKVLRFYLEDWRNLPDELWNALRGIPHG